MASREAAGCRCYGGRTWPFTCRATICSISRKPTWPSSTSLSSRRTGAYAASRTPAVGVVKRVTAFDAERPRWAFPRRAWERVSTYCACRGFLSPGRQAVLKSDVPRSERNSIPLADGLSVSRRGRRCTSQAPAEQHVVELHGLPGVELVVETGTGEEHGSVSGTSVVSICPAGMHPATKSGRQLC